MTSIGLGTVPLEREQEAVLGVLLLIDVGPGKSAKCM
jgi:hypothetical protein